MGKNELAFEINILSIIVWIYCNKSLYRHVILLFHHIDSNNVVSLNSRCKKL